MRTITTSRKRRGIAAIVAIASGLALAAWPAGPAGPARGAGTGDLMGEANRIAAKQLEQFGKAYTARIDPGRHIVYVSALDEAHLQQTIRLLTAFTDAYRRTLPASRAEWNVTVVLPTADDYQKLKPPFEGCTGFYSPAGHRVVAIDRGRTLLHEFTHALHHADAAADRQVHPMWVVEGLATLFESAEITPSGLRPGPDIRLPTVQRAVKDHKAIPLARLLAMGRDAFLKDAELAYAQSRYVMYFLHSRGRLDDWYQRYKADIAHDPDGVKAFEAAAGNRVSIVEGEWHKWLLSLEMPSSEPRLQQARLGLQVQADPRGVKVVGMLPGSPAKTAGRIRVGDIIQKFNGHAITNTGEMVGAIRSTGAMQTVRIDLLRHGRTMTVVQPLGAPGAS